ncbi:hypothetical protein DUI87_34162 [Hirundo rustica rustica]|uniref:G-protein coupled receptors family 1 profile domain-containing protein n=1 Tax=Hirundo rustica rustica TaxID=333673 RepID=A0A3M0IMY3_HIRRU|nr:hypothetical protein DUI87_34162 [Hirundo rustica rustica]
MDSISQVIHDCETCAAIKQAKRVKPLWYGGRWSKYKYGEAWQIDYITLPQTRQGKRYVLTMVEATTGWLETYPVPHATARNTILGLEKQVLWRHGTPGRFDCWVRTVCNYHCVLNVRVSTKDTNTSRPVYREWHGFGSKQPVLTCHCPLSMNMSPWPATAISNSSSISHFLLLALPDTRQLQLLHFCFFLGIPLAALQGNSLIISTTACGHHLHTPMFFFLLNLALTHLGSICTTVPKAMSSSLWDTRHISYAGCAAQVSIFFCLMSVEYFLLTIMRFDHYVSICKLLHYGTLLGSTACAHMAAAAWASAFLNALMHTANTFSLPLCQGNALGQFFCEIPHILKLSCSKSYLRELGLIAVTASLLFGCFVFIVFS